MKKLLSIILITLLLLASPVWAGPQITHEDAYDPAAVAITGGTVNVTSVETDTLKVTTGAAAGNMLVSDADGDLGYLSAGATTTVLVGGGAANPVWTTATGTGAPVRATSPTITDANLATSATGVVASNAKTQLINAVYGIVTPANVKGFWIFDQTGAVSTITDRSTIGGASAHTVTLWDGPDPINASTMTPGASGLAPYLTCGNAKTWYAADSADFTFAAGNSFSVLIMTKPSETVSVLLGKRVSGQKEWHLTFSANKITANFWESGNDAIYIGRSYNTDISGDAGTVHTYGFSYGGGTTSATINIMRDGAIIDDTDSVAGVFTTMGGGTSIVAPGVPGEGWPNGGTYYVALIVAEELTAVQAARLDAILRGYAGVAL